MNEQDSIKEALEGMSAELRSLRAELAAARRDSPDLPGAPDPLAAPAWAWVVCGRDPDDARRIALVAVTFSQEAAEANIARVRAHERTTNDFPYQLSSRKVRAGVNYLYELDREPGLDLF